MGLLDLTETNMDTTIDIKERVNTALDAIRPYLKTDGGDVKVLDVTDGVVKLELMGSCGSCPMSAMTLKAGIEESIRKAIPEIKEVQAVNVTPT